MNFLSRTHVRSGASRHTFLPIFWSVVAASFVVTGTLSAGTPAATPVYTLGDCLALVRRQNPDVLAAAKRVDQIRAQVITAKSGLYPALTTNGYVQYREQSLATEGGDASTNRKEDYSGDVRLQQNVFSSQAVRNRVASAKLLAEAENNTYQAQIDASTLSARVSFYQALYAEASISIRQEAVDLLETQLKDQRDRLAAGSVGQLNVNRAQVALANERPALLDAQAAVQTAYVTLAQTLGVAYPPDANTRPFQLRGSLSCPPMRMSLAECLARAQSGRPEIASRKLVIEGLRHQIIVEKATTRPQVNAYAAYDVYSEPSILSTRDYFSGYTLGIQASWNIFDGFATRGRVRSVQAQAGAAEAQLEGTRQQVEAEVRTAYYELRLAMDSLPPLAENIRLANETHTLYARNFDAGLNSQLEVLQARVDLTRARLTELNERLRYESSLARLERAMGMGRPTQGSATNLGADAK